MDQNTELRQLPELTSIAEYLRTMRFKKKLLGGCDTENVLDHFSVVALQYEAVISACMAHNGQQAGRVAALEAELARREQENALYAENQRRMAQWYEANIAWLQVQRGELMRRIEQLTLQAGAAAYDQYNAPQRTALYG